MPLYVLEVFGKDGWGPCSPRGTHFNRRTAGAPVAGAPPAPGNGPSSTNLRGQEQDTSKGKKGAAGSKV